MLHSSVCCCPACLSGSTSSHECQQPPNCTPPPLVVHICAQLGCSEQKLCATQPGTHSALHDMRKVCFTHSCAAALDDQCFHGLSTPHCLPCRGRYTWTSDCTWPKGSTACQCCINTTVAADAREPHTRHTADTGNAPKTCTTVDVKCSCTGKCIIHSACRWHQGQMAPALQQGQANSSAKHSWMNIGSQPHGVWHTSEWPLNTALSSNSQSCNSAGTNTHCHFVACHQKQAQSTLQRPSTHQLAGACQTGGNGTAC